MFPFVKKEEQEKVKTSKEEIQLNVSEIIGSKEFKTGEEVSLAFIEISALISNNKNILEEENTILDINFSGIKQLELSALSSLISLLNLKFPRIKFQDKYFFTGIRSHSKIDFLTELSKTNESTAEVFVQDITHSKELTSTIKKYQQLKNRIRLITTTATIFAVIFIFHSIFSLKRYYEINSLLDTKNLLKNSVSAFIQTNQYKIEKNNYDKLISSIMMSADKYQIEPFFLPAIISRESEFKKFAVSRKPNGDPMAMGYMQVYFSVWGVPVTDTNVQELFDEEFNIKMGTYIFNHYYSRDRNLYRTMVRYNGGDIGGINSKYVNVLAESHLYIERIFDDYYLLNKIKNEQINKAKRIASIEFDLFKEIAYTIGVYKP